MISRVHLLAVLAGLLDAADSAGGEEAEPAALVARAAAIVDAAQAHVAEETLEQARKITAQHERPDGIPS